MDIADVTDIKELKALAFDQLVLQQQTENNLRMLTQRIEQLTNQQVPEMSSKSSKKSES